MFVSLNWHLSKLRVAPNTPNPGCNNIRIPVATVGEKCAKSALKSFFFSLILYITVHLPLLIICLCSSAACCIVFNILQRILNPVLWCFTSHLSPLISTPASVISISPPLPFLFFKRPFLSPLMSLITSTPLHSPPTCTLHNPPSSLDSHVLLDPFPPLSLFSVFLRDSRFTIVITFFCLSCLCDYLVTIALATNSLDNRFSSYPYIFPIQNLLRVTCCFLRSPFIFPPLLLSLNCPLLTVPVPYSRLCLFIASLTLCLTLFLFYSLATMFVAFRSVHI